MKVSQGEPLRLIKSLDMGKGYPEGMSMAPKEGIYFIQRDCKYSVKGYGDNVIEAWKYKLKLNLYFNPFKRAEDQLAMELAAVEQSLMMDDIIKDGSPVDDVPSTVKRFNLLSINCNKDKSIKSYEVNRDKMETMLLTSGFFASKTFGVDFDSLKGKDNYGMRDEQEKNDRTSERVARAGQVPHVVGNSEAGAYVHLLHRTHSGLACPFCPSV